MPLESYMKTFEGHCCFYVFPNYPDNCAMLIILLQAADNLAY